jgi:hypothetical protein
MGEGLGGFLAVQGISTAAGVGNSISNAQALRGQQQYANAMTDVNSEWSRIQQSQLTQNASLAGSAARSGYNRLASTQRAAFAANGVNVNTGSAGAVQSETRALGQIERLQIQQAAYNQAIGLRAENLAAVGQNRMRQIAVRQGINASYINAGAQVGAGLVRGAAAYDRYQGLGKTGAPKSSLDMTLDYTPKDLMPPTQPYEPDVNRRSEYA